MELSHDLMSCLLGLLFVCEQVSVLIKVEEEMTNV
jgi:hypothetical protein